MLLFASTLPLVITATVLFVGAAMLCFSQWNKTESCYRKTEHRLKEVTGGEVITITANCEENEKAKVDCNQNLEHVPDQNFKHTPNKKLEEVAIEHVGQANIRQVVAG